MLVFAFVFGTVPCVAAGERNDAFWPQFRGPAGQGIGNAESIPIDFGLDHGLKWRTAIKGKGWSSPVIADGRIWITTSVTTEATPEERAARLANVQEPQSKEVAGSIELSAICVDLATGEILHDISLAKFDDPDPIHPLNSYSSPTPVIDGQRLFCHFGSYGTWCLDANTGGILWTRRLVIDHSVGPGGSPAIVGDHLIIVCDGIDAQFIASLNPTTGEEQWRTSRPPMRATNGEFQKAYSTPMLIEVKGETQVVIPGAQWIVAYEPTTGKEIWRVDHGNGFSISSTAIYTGTPDRVGLVVFTTGFGQSEVVAIRPDGMGDVTLSHIAWRTDRGVPAKPSLVASGKLLYMIDDNGVFTCLNSDDASVVFRKRVQGNFSASPLLVAGYIFLCNQEGVITIVKQGLEFEEIATIQLDEKLMASPAVANNDLLIRSEHSLMRFTSEKSEAGE